MKPIESLGGETEFRLWFLSEIIRYSASVVRYIQNTKLTSFNGVADDVADTAGKKTNR
jgi:hypothetical protein